MVDGRGAVDACHRRFYRPNGLLGTDLYAKGCVSLQLWDLGLDGWVAVVPWVAPAMVGVPATFIWVRHYQKKFGEVTAQPAD